MFLVQMLLGGESLAIFFLSLSLSAMARSEVLFLRGNPPFQVIAAEGEQKASRALKEASEVIAESSSALQLRYLQVSQREKGGGVPNQQRTLNKLPTEFRRRNFC